MAAPDREWIDFVLLIFAFLAGICSIVIFKIGDYSVWLPALTSAIVIIAYAVVTSVSGRARLNPGQIGDNAYYLGFVLTLASLAVTLYQLGSRPQISELFGDVIAGFGIALSSTIVGIIVRVLLLQYRVDLVEREKEVRLELNNAMRRFRIDVEDFVRGVKYLGTEILQSLDENHQKISDSYEQRIANLAGDVSAGYQKIFDEVVEHGKQVNKDMASSVHSSISSVEKAVLETLESVTGQLHETGVTVNEGTRTAADVLKHNLQETNELMSASLRDLRAEVQRSIKEISRIHAENMKRESDLMGNSAISMQQAASSFTKNLEESLTKVEEKIAKFSDASGRVNEVMVQLNESLEKMNDQVSKTANQRHKPSFIGFFNRNRDRGTP